mmetsp:Transcript_37446/g.73400  ORF Transcript_37446/g.73400 Transcript_37446/m.73400 type:complete len:98 (+) Transcript_37446:568-861(+)
MNERVQKRDPLLLSQVALINIDYDGHTEEIYGTRHEKFRPKSEILIPEQIRAIFKSGGIFNTSKLKRQIIRDRHASCLKSYIQEKTNWTEAQFLSGD